MMDLCEFVGGLLTASNGCGGCGWLYWVYQTRGPLGMELNC